MLFFKIKPLKYYQLKGARPPHDPLKYCHVPPEGPAPHVGNQGSRLTLTNQFIVFISILITILNFSST